MKMPENQKVYHQVEKAGTLMIPNQVRSGASSALPRKLCKSASTTDWQKCEHIKQEQRRLQKKINCRKFLSYLANKRNVQLSKRWHNFHFCTCLFPGFSDCPLRSWLPNFHVTGRKSPMSTSSIYAKPYPVTNNDTRGIKKRAISTVTNAWF